MELITILNRCHRFRGFVYQHAYFSADKKSIEVAVRPRKGSAAVCSLCHFPAPGYDQLVFALCARKTLGELEYLGKKSTPVWKARWHGRSAAHKGDRLILDQSSDEGLIDHYLISSAEYNIADGEIKLDL